MKNDSRSINIINIGIRAAELLTSSQDITMNYERSVRFLFENLMYLTDRIRLYVGDESGENFQEEVICMGAGIITGSDVVPLYQLPKTLTRDRQLSRIYDSKASYLLVPLVHNARLMGFLELRVIKAGEDEYWDEIGLMADTFAMGLNHAILMQENIRVKQYYEAIARIVNHIQSINNIDALVSDFVRYTAKELKFDRVTVFIYERGSRNAAWSRCADSNGTIRQLRDVPELPVLKDKPEPLMYFSGCWFPLMTRTSVIGAILFDNIYSSFAIPERLGEMLPSLCNQFAAAFESIRLFMDIQNSAQHDKLTGLYNRAFFEEEMQRLDTARQLPLSIIIGDVNGLKITNDVFGHFEGDKILKTAADIMCKVCRSEDIIARWGGDEFVILLPHTSEKTAEEICDRIIKTCSSGSDTIIQMSISLGFAAKTDIGEDMQHVLKNAEDRMYRNKLFESKSFRNSFVTTLKDSLFSGSQETMEHIGRMEQLSVVIGTAMDLTYDELDELKLLAMFHDIGKVAVSRKVLNKPGRLDEAEWGEVRMHSETGYRIAHAASDISRIADFILYHHERWDGTGYPFSKKGFEIPKLSRIISVIDAYDVMTHARVYKNAISHNEAVDELARCAGSQFDPYIVEVFIKLFGKSQ